MIRDVRWHRTNRAGGTYSDQLQSHYATRGGVKNSRIAPEATCPARGPLADAARARARGEGETEQLVQDPTCDRGKRAWARGISTLVGIKAHKQHISHLALVQVEPKDTHGVSRVACTNECGRPRPSPPHPYVTRGITLQTTLAPFGLPFSYGAPPAK